jgi:hypothetical protein
MFEQSTGAEYYSTPFQAAIEFSITAELRRSLIRFSPVGPNLVNPHKPEWFVDRIRL